MIMKSICLLTKDIYFTFMTLMMNSNKKISKSEITKSIIVLNLSSLDSSAFKDIRSESSDKSFINLDVFFEKYLRKIYIEPETICLILVSSIDINISSKEQLIASQYCYYQF